jgi:hypothetical protein
MGKLSSPLKLGKEIYGIVKIEEAFSKALELYFREIKVQR